MSEHELPYGPAAQRLFEALLDREEFSESDYRIVATALERQLLFHYRSVGVEEISDISAATVLALLEEIDKHRRPDGSMSRRDFIESPAAWMSSVAARKAVDRLRKAKREGVFPDTDIPDDSLAELFESRATRATVHDCVRIAGSNGDFVVVAVVRAFLELAPLTRSAPSSRAIARVTGYSHPTVSAALRRFGNCLQAHL